MKIVNAVMLGLSTVVAVACGGSETPPASTASAPAAAPASAASRVFFVTPIMWLPEILAARGVVWVANTNPIYHFIEIVRAPLSGAGTPVMSWLAVVAVTVLGWMLALAVLYRFRHRVPYWL